MFKGYKIITVGISPSWDITCRVEGVDWGDHVVLDSQQITAAGKAMNISRALAEMGIANTAAGIWGHADYEQMLAEIGGAEGPVTPKMVRVPGRTRQNITIIDTLNRREMHLRSSSGLADESSLGRLEEELLAMAGEKKVFVFSGSLPRTNLLDKIVQTIEKLHEQGAKIVVDSSGPGLRKLVDSGHICLIKPNIAELSELIQKQLVDDTSELVKAARALLGKVGAVLVSRGQEGALIVSPEGSLAGRFDGRARPVLRTVGCGDYLLAGFVAGLVQVGESGFALQKGLIAATARAFGAGLDERSLVQGVTLRAV